MLQMLALVVNSYLDATDAKEYKRHKAKASMMDLGDMSVPRTDFSMPSEGACREWRRMMTSPPPQLTSKRSFDHWMSVFCRYCRRQDNLQTPKGFLGAIPGRMLGQPKMLPPQ